MTIPPVDVTEFPREAVVDFVAKIVGVQDAEDVAQDVVVKLLTSSAVFERRSTWRTWIFAVAKHTALDHLRARHRDPLSTPIDLANLLSVGYRPGAGLMVDLVRAIDDLTPGEWAVVEARILHPTVAEAAASVSMHYQAYRSKLRRVRALLKLLLEEGVGDGAAISGDVPDRSDGGDCRQEHARGRRTPPKPGA
jgi:RNA polymerase sigma-70 factor (ECF subfamily)